MPSRVRKAPALTVRWLTIVALAAAGVSGCAPRRGITLPTGAGLPFGEAEQVHAALAAPCRAVRTLTTELGLAGRVDGQRLRGRVIAGFERPASMRLEGVAPFGPPAFIVASRAGTAVLLLPRDRRVVRDASAASLLAALTGVALGPDDLQAILTGCVIPFPEAVSGQRYGEAWASVDLVGGATVFLRREAGAWVLRAARREDWQLEYSGRQGDFPQSVRLRSVRGTPSVDLPATMTQFMTNVEIEPAAFSLDVPVEALPMTVEELARGAAWRR